MKARVAASVVIAVGVVLGTAGCNLIAPQATTYKYDASDGVSGTVGDIDVRNAFLVAEGSSINLVADLVNTGSEAETVTVQPNASADDDQTISVPAGSTVSIGDAKRLQWNTFKVSAGSLFPVFFSYGDQSGVNIKLPVLTGDMQEYSSYTPTPVETPAG